jgi:hypothetical protein
MHIFYINILILMSPTCSEPEGTSSGRRLYMQLWYVSSIEHPSTNKTAYTDKCKTYHNCIYNHLPEDEPSVSEYVEDTKIKILI